MKKREPKDGDNEWENQVRMGKEEEKKKICCDDSERKTEKKRDEERIYYEKITSIDTLISNKGRMEYLTQYINYTKPG